MEKNSLRQVTTPKEKNKCVGKLRRRIVIVWEDSIYVWFCMGLFERVCELLHCYAGSFLWRALQKHWMSVWLCVYPRCAIIMWKVPYVMRRIFFLLQSRRQHRCRHSNTMWRKHVCQLTNRWNLASLKAFEKRRQTANMLHQTTNCLIL